MTTRIELLRLQLEIAARTVRDNVAGLTLEEALFVPPGGYRSTLGTLKHIAGWSHVYRAYAFDEQPRHWRHTSWPRGLRDTVDLSQTYVDEVIAWFDQSQREWVQALDGLTEDEADEPRRLHWGELAPLATIVAMIANHDVYHAGEINQLLSIRRGEAWEETEEVEENHISTAGHRVKPSWMSH